jgi:DNA-binding winged helix-turn-helix (wHTH) protein
MDHSKERDPVVGDDFLLGEWLVQPSLNRLSRDDTVIQLEPKLMDVLAYLAANAGQVVSKIDITDAVWPDVFITESVITRSIAGLRRSFGDDVRNPSYIETISKRGYRLIAEVRETRDHTARAVQPAVIAGPPRSTVPYVVGQWVRGDKFYGRTQAVDEVLAGNRNWIWLLGTRRIGKTSLLKQLEFVASSKPDLGYVPIFWDLQGADSPDELHRDFADALLDAVDHLERAEVAVEEVRADNCFDSLARLRRVLLSRNLRLLLLCDEVEELIHLHEQDPSLLRKLRRALQSKDGIRSVLASSSRLWQLADAGEHTSPFLDGFTPPLAIGPLTTHESRGLILQSQLPESAQPPFSEEHVEKIQDLCGGHPYLIQMLCRQLLDRHDLDEAVEAIHHDRAVAFFFAVDFELVNESEQSILLHLAAAGPTLERELLSQLGRPVTEARTDVSHLQSLGLLHTDAGGRYCVGNEFLRRWLEERPP